MFPGFPIRLVRGQLSGARILLVAIAFFLSYCSADESQKEIEPATEIPHVYITTTGKQEIGGEYVQGVVRIEEGTGTRFEGTARIKLRGNSTAGYPKKPFHIKLDQSSEVLGLASNKDWILLANFLDNTLLTNAIALKSASLLNMPYTNHILPVDVTVNGVYQGSYNFTEQVETGKNRVNIEPDGQLLELDQYFDEEWKFRTTDFDLPVMVKYPKLTSASQLTPIQNQFETLTALVGANSFPNNAYLNYMDEESVINFLLVMLITDNEELNHPKSTFLYKPAGGKYHMGPMWDFDWAYGFEGEYQHFNTASFPLFWQPTSNFSGGSFFYRFLENPQTKAKLVQKWNDFKTNKLPMLIDYVETYSKQIETSYQKDYAVWASEQSDRSPNIDPERIQTWLLNRATFIDAYLTQIP